VAHVLGSILLAIDLSGNPDVHTQDKLFRFAVQTALVTYRNRLY
jgi:hypothetical protein